MKKILLVDGYNLFIRCFVVNPTMDANGERVGGAIGMIQSIGKLISEFNPDQVVVIWDGANSSQRRRGIYAEYKAGRRVRLNSEYDFGDAQSDYDNMQKQRELVFELLDMVAIPQVRADSTEADDLIAFSVKHVDGYEKKIIVSTDADMLQLVDDKTQVYSPIKKILYTKENFLEKIGILPENFSLMKALVGDKSDNIDGIKGFGEKTVKKLFPFLSERKSSIKEILEKAKEAKGTTAKRLVEESETFEKNMTLVDLSDPASNVSASAALSARDAIRDVTKQCREFDLRVKLMKEGISTNDQRLIQPFRGLSLIRHPKCPECRKKVGPRCPIKCTDV